MDTFKPLDISLGDFLELAEKDPISLFNMIKTNLRYIKGIEGVRVLKRFFDPKEFNVVIEYLVRCDLGEVSVKLIYSKDPGKALAKYYEWEKRVSS